MEKISGRLLDYKMHCFQTEDTNSIVYLTRQISGLQKPLKCKEHLLNRKECKQNYIMHMAGLEGLIWMCVKGNTTMSTLLHLEKISILFKVGYLQE